MSEQVIFFLRRARAAIWSAALLLGLLYLALWTWQRAHVDSPRGEGGSLEGLRILGTLPDFTLIERSGRPVKLEDLRGKVWIADFIYTHCTDTCPLQSAEMARLQADLEAETDVRLVSITVDPAEDSPEVLAEYAARFGADRDRWLFLTGQKRAIYTLAQQGFLLSVEDPGDAVPAPPAEQRSTTRPGPGRTQASDSRWLAGIPAVSGPAEILASLLQPVRAMAHPGHLGAPFLHSSWFILVDRQARIRGYYRSEDEQAMRRLRGDVRALLREKS